MTPIECLFFKCAEAILGAAVIIFPTLHWIGF